MGILYIAGQRQGAGSTALAVALANLWRRAGRKVALAKPVVFAESDKDSDLFAKVTGAKVAAPLVMGTTVTGDVLESAAKRVQGLAKEADVVIVEGLPMTGADGASLPASAELAKKMQAKVIGVLPYSRTLGRDDAAVWQQAYGDALAGAVVNRRTLYAEHDASVRLAPELQEAGLPSIGVVGEDRLMLAPTVQQVIDAMEGTIYTGVDETGELIEHFLIGALITEWGGNYFGRYPNQAVLARCGRIDLQMAALNFPLNALFLTAGCPEPPQYVFQRADYMDVPLVTLRHTTQEAVEALGSLNVTVHHPAKVERFTALVERSLDMGALSSAGSLS